MELEEKARRRLAPFVAFGQIFSPQFEGREAEKPLMVAVRLRPGSEASSLQSAMLSAMSDLGEAAHLVVRANWFFALSAFLINGFVWWDDAVDEWDDDVDEAAFVAPHLSNFFNGLFPRFGAREMRVKAWEPPFFISSFWR